MILFKHDLRACDDVRSRFSEYLDGQTPGRAMQEIASHLEVCSACMEEFDAWRTVQQSLTKLQRSTVPADLGLKLRLAISHEKARQSTSVFETLSLRWVNTLRPMVVQVSAGLAMAVALLGTVGTLLGTVAVPPAVMANDEPLGAMTAPRYLYSMERQRSIQTGHDQTIVVEAEINDRGQVYDYSVVSGPQDPFVRSQIEGQLLISVFDPARVFGVPIRGRAIVTYAGLSVHA